MKLLAAKAFEIKLECFLCKGIDNTIVDHESSGIWKS